MESLSDEQLKDELLELCLSVRQKRKLPFVNDCTSIADGLADKKRERAVEPNFCATDRLFYKELEETIAYGQGKSAPFTCK
jgi:hypothetical protein